jgi:molybdopterin synthase catalytic subunit
MRVSLRLFAGLHDIVGARTLDLEVEPGSRVDDLKQRLATAYPAVGPYLKTVVFAVDDEYVTNDQALRDGDEVALIPPVSGGDDGSLFQLTEAVLDPQALVKLVERDDCGGLALFYGNVRNHNEGRGVARIEYEAHASMALRKLREAGAETRQRFPMIGAIGVWHRVGRLEIGETSLLVAVSAPHRKEAFEACHWAVDRVKEIVPIWKKEIWQEGGGAWVDGHAVELPETSRPG